MRKHVPSLFCSVLLPPLSTAAKCEVTVGGFSIRLPSLSQKQRKIVAPSILLSCLARDERNGEKMKNEVGNHCLIKVLLLLRKKSFFFEACYCSNFNFSPLQHKKFASQKNRPIFGSSPLSSPLFLVCARNPPYSSSSSFPLLPPACTYLISLSSRNWLNVVSARHLFSADIFRQLELGKQREGVVGK